MSVCDKSCRIWSGAWRDDFDAEEGDHEKNFAE